MINATDNPTLVAVTLGMRTTPSTITPTATIVISVYTMRAQLRPFITKLISSPSRDIVIKNMSVQTRRTR